MDSTHRHELKQNELGQITLKAAPWIEQHGAQLLWVIGGVLVATVFGLWWVQTSSIAKSAGWSKLAAANSLEDFGGVVEKFGGTLPGIWAQIQEAELNLESGIQNRFKDRELADKDLEKAKKDFEAALNSNVVLPVAVRERAQLGLARVLETTCDGDTGPVVAAYQEVLKISPDSIYKSYIDQRVKDLQTGGAAEFYAWFHKQSPKPPEFKKPLDGLLPKTPLTTPETGEKKTEAPSAGETPPSKPAEDKPATETPAPEKPAAETPAAEKTPEPKPEASTEKPEEPAKPEPPK